MIKVSLVLGLGEFGYIPDPVFVTSFIIFFLFHNLSIIFNIYIYVTAIVPGVLEVLDLIQPCLPCLPCSGLEPPMVFFWHNLWNFDNCLSKVLKCLLSSDQKKP